MKTGKEARFRRLLLLTSVLVAICLFTHVDARAADTTTGWRANWTGKFPDANPPVKWRKVSKAMSGLRCQAERPKDDKPSGVSSVNGCFTEWLVLGPLSSAGGENAIDEELVKDEANWKPDAREQVKNVAWKKVKTMGSVLDFAQLFSRDLPHPKPGWNNAIYYTKPYIAYACTYVYSPRAVTLDFSLRALADCRIYINGTLVFAAGGSKEERYKQPFELELRQGWNRILYKVGNRVSDRMPKMGRNPWSTWFVDLGVRAVRPYETDTENILWQTRLPYYHIGCPLIVGDKVFVMSKPGDLVCLDKEDGKVRWIRSTTYYDLPEEKEKQEDPRYKEIVPVVKELEGLNALYVKQNDADPEVIHRRQALYAQIQKSMGAIDKKYRGGLGHYQKANMPTPVSDGKHVYIWLEDGIAACYDLDGNRRWIAMPGKRHGARYMSPVISAGKMVFVEGIRLIAFDKKNGHVAWKTPPLKTVCQSPVPFEIKDVECIYYNDTIVRAADGKVLWQGSPATRNNITTSVMEKGTIYNVAVKGTLPTDPGDAAITNRRRLWDTGRRRIPKPQSFVPSSLYHDGLLYTVDVDGYLYVSDTEEGGLVYMQELGMGKEHNYDYYHHPFGRVHASLVMAGDHIYVWGLHGVTVVMKPGREYREVARNKIEDDTFVMGRRITSKGEYIPENFGSTPVAERDRFYVRGSSYLYCIGRKQE